MPLRHAQGPRYCLALGLADSYPSMSDLNPISFAGVLDIITPPKTADQLDGIDQEAVTDDLEGEKESLPGPGPTLRDDGALHVSELLTTLNDVSRGVSDRTHNEYQR